MQTIHVILITILLLPVYSDLMAEEPIPKDLCGNFFIPQTVQSMTVKGLCLIEDSFGTENLEHDRVILLYNENSESNVVALIKGNQKALLVNKDLFYLAEQGNESEGGWLIGKAAVWGFKKLERYLDSRPTPKPNRRDYEPSDHQDSNNDDDSNANDDSNSNSNQSE